MGIKGLLIGSGELETEIKIIFTLNFALFFYRIKRLSQLMQEPQKF